MTGASIQLPMAITQPIASIQSRSSGITQPPIIQQTKVIEWIFRRRRKICIEMTGNNSIFETIKFKNDD